MHQGPESNWNKIEEGFSSEDQFKDSEILYTQTLKDQPELALKQEIKLKIPPAQEIKNKKYSLNPDLATGWQPKIQLPSPVPIIFESPKYDNLIKRLVKMNQSKTRICYLGPKYSNTYYAWYGKPFSFPYNHVKSSNNIKFSDRQFCGQHQQAEQDLNFDSFFEGGNLDCAVKVFSKIIKVGQYEYDLFMRVDSNTQGHLQWFNFKIKNLKKGQDYQFNICNFQKKKILYDRGLKPYVYSQQTFLRQKIGWQQKGENVSYEKKVSKTFKALDIQTNKYYKLSFTISTQYQHDELQISYCVPYTYSEMLGYVRLKLKQLQKSNLKILKVSKLCNSLGGLQVPLLIIHESDKLQTELDRTDDCDQTPTIKKCVIICGRVHPGQSNGSYMVEGFLDFICGDTKMAEFLRRHTIFKIVPMLNPDGVILGNYRTGLSGKDFNREYKDPDKQLFPEVFFFKKLVTDNKMIFKQNLSIFLDFHGHSVKKNTFVYGPEFPIIDKFYYESRIIPKILNKLTPMFRYHSCSFKVSEYKNTTARAILLRRLNIPLTYTIQASNGFYFDYQKLKDVSYTDTKWKFMGQKVGEAVYQYIKLLAKADMLRHQKQKARKITKKKQILAKKNIRSTSTNQNYQMNPTSKNSVRFLQKSCQSFILQNFQDQGIRNLFEEIKQAEQQKISILQTNKCSDDQMSEGSSDLEGEEDDLSRKHQLKLFNCIKNKKYKSLQKCKFSSIKRRKTNNLEEDNSIQKDLKMQQLLPSRQSQELIKNSPKQPKQNSKKQFILNQIQTKKRLNVTKVNFSFALNSSPHRQRIDKNSIFPIKLNFFDLAKSKDQIVKNESNQKLVDMTMRKTFHSGIKVVQEKKKQIDSVNIFTTAAFISKKSNNQTNRNNLNQNTDQGLSSVQTQQKLLYRFANRRNLRIENVRMKKMIMEGLSCG